MITIKEITTKAELKKFIKFSFDLYKGNPYWVPPLISEELDSFDKTKNPVFKNAEAKFYLAYRDGKIVGKVAAIVNWQEVEILGKKKVRFGWFDFIDDIEVSRALLEKVYEFGRQHGMDAVEGPMGFSNLDKVGVLTEGFDQIGTAVTWYNYPYYKEHLEQLGFTVEKGYRESIFSMRDVDPAPFKRGSQMIQKRYGLRAVNCKTTAEVMPHVDKMFVLFNKAYTRLSSFVPISDVQIAYFKKKYVGQINPEYIKFVEDAEGNMVAFTIVMPSFAEALQKAGGKLFPFGFIHLLRAKKHSRDVAFYLIGIDPEYQNKGVTAIIFDDFYDVFVKNNIRNCIRTPELDDNHAMENLWKNFNPKIHKRRKTYSKPL